MGNKLKIALSLALLAGLYSCEADFSGLVRSTDRVEDRFLQSSDFKSDFILEDLPVIENNYRVIIASDLHVGGTVNTKRLFDYYEETDFAALILAGDLVSGRREDYEVFKELVDSVEKPVFTMVGNHDLYFDGWKTYYEFFGTSTYYFLVTTPQATDIYICLDSGGGTLGKSQTEWLVNLLETKRDDYRYCFVISHVNMLRTRRTTSANPMIEEVAFLLDLYAKHDVTMVINGHDHLQDAVEFGNTTYLITDALTDTYEDAGYLILEVGETDTDYEFVRF
jgi:3',5'-cyclic AMP phosphodiesterase CpdA